MRARWCVAVLAAMVMACEASDEDCGAILVDEEDPRESLEIVIRNPGPADVKLFADDECDQVVTSIDRSTLPPGWQWDLTNAGPVCGDLVAAQTPREGACWYPDPVDVASGTEVAIPLRVLGFEPLDVPPACSDEPVCYARRSLPAGYYTGITWVGTLCPDSMPGETCAPCEPAGDLCRDGFYIREVRFEIDLEHPSQRSIAIEI